MSLPPAAPQFARFARVMIDQSADREFDYSIPEALASRVQVGSRVRVPLRSRSLLATVVHLPEIGIRGNTHFPMSDLNNVQIADQVSRFLAEKKLD